MIADNVRALLAEIPPQIQVLAAAKGRTAVEVMEAIVAGVKTVGENYLQEAQEHASYIGSRACWHFIGTLQLNKVRAAVKLFDMIETVGSATMAESIDRHCASTGRIMPVLLEINSGREPQKSGVLPEDAAELTQQISCLQHIRIEGLMTMGPRFGDPEASRPYFSATRHLFDNLKSIKFPNVEMKYLSMGMTNSYRIAIQEGANIVRIGSKIFEDA